MPKKHPRPFNKPLPVRAFQRRVRNRIYLEHDRTFLDDITTTDDEGRIVLARELTTEERTRLGKLTKEARKNRGAVRTGKVLVLALLVGGVLAFNYLFKDRLVEEGGERMLSSLFGARADITGVDFRPLSGEISFRSLTVADADHPMTNLFELGEGRLSVDTWQLLSGKVLIDNLTVDGLAFGTQRAVSGALAVGHDSDGATTGDAGLGETGDGRAPDDRPGTPPGGVSFASLGLPDTLDAQAFLAREMDILETPRQVESVLQSGGGYIARWQDRVDELTRAGVDSAARIQELAATDFTAIGSVDQAIALVDESSAAVTDASTYVDRVQQAVDGATTEARQILATAARLPDLAQEDYQRILSRIPVIQAQGQDFLAGIAESYLREQLGAWYDRILTAYAYFGRLEQVAQGPGALDRRQSGRRSGRIVDFSTQEYPSFELRRAFVSSNGDRQRDLVIEALSSNADITGAPAMITYSESETRDEGTNLRLGAVVDQRSGAAAPLSLTVAASGQPVVLDEGLEALDLETFGARSTLELGLLQPSDAPANGSVHLFMDAIVLTGSPEAGSIGELVRDVLTRASSLEARFEYAVGIASPLSFTSAETNLDEQIAGVVQERIDATVALFEQRIEEELQALIDREIGRLDETIGDVVDVRETMEELLALATDREAAAKALEERASTAINAVRDELEAQARAQIEAARAEAERAAREAEAAVRAEAERAAREAEAAARAEAERAAEEVRRNLPLPLPGF